MKVSSMMTAGPSSGQTPIPAGSAPAHTLLARSAVGLAGVAAVLITVGLVALAVFGEGLGVLLSAFPVALAVLVLGEVFWWE